MNKHANRNASNHDLHERGYSHAIYQDDRKFAALPMSLSKYEKNSGLLGPILSVKPLNIILHNSCSKTHLQ